MLQRRVVRGILSVAAIVLVSLSGGMPARATGGQQEGEPMLGARQDTETQPNAGQQDAEALLGRLRELLAATETKVLLVPFPNSRSRILKADGSSEFFLYLERGNLRGTETMDEFYAALDANDMAAANDVFTRHSLVSLRISDYGWNGLGVPMERDDGSGGESIQDRFYKNNEGLFGPVDPTPEDVATYLEYVETILIPALEGGS